VSNLNDDNSAGSLRAILAQANADGGGDTVVFAPGLSGTITLTGGELVLNQDVTIRGPGAGRLTINGNANRIFEVDAGHVTISGLTLTAGVANGGGAVLNFAALTLSGDVLTGNTDTGGTQGGGAVLSSGGAATLTIDRCRLSNNTSNWTGGAISLIDGGSLTLTNSTVDHNSSNRDGGGITVQSITADATATVINSTIASNSAALGFRGGGIQCIGSGSGTSARLTLQYSTLDGNTAPGGGGGVASSFNLGTAAVSYRDTLFAVNSNGNVAGSSGGTVTSLGHNLSDDGTGNLTAPGDLPNTSPGLGPLQDNGGPTPTMALLTGSPAVGAGVAVPGISTDQRGFRRPASAPDIGAYQTEPSLNVTGTSVTAIATVPFTGQIASFTSGEPSPVAAGFAVAIDWGDGTPLDTTSGAVAGSVSSGFVVRGSHVYAAAGSPTISVTVTDLATNVDATATSAATVVPFAASVDLEAPQIGPSRATAGGKVTYTLTVTNLGPAVAQDVTLTDVVPDTTTFVAATQTSGPAFTLITPPVGGTGTFIADPVALAAGQSATFVVVYQAGVTGPLTNIVTVSTTTPNRHPPGSPPPLGVPVQLTLSITTLADFSAAGTTVGTLVLTVPATLVGQFLPPLFGLPAGEATNAAFALAAGAAGEALVTQFPACSGARASYTVSVHVDVGFGDQAVPMLVTVVPAASPCTSATAGPVLETVQVVPGGKQGLAQQLVLTFSTALDPGSATGLAHYAVRLGFTGTGKHRKAILVRVAAATYDPVRHTVTLRLGRVKNPKARSTLTVEGLLGFNGVLGNAAVVSIDLRPKPSRKA
jgi:uncharacterized repeat protein (TIGR01451 family)